MLLERNSGSDPPISSVHEKYQIPHRSPRLYLPRQEKDSRTKERRQHMKTKAEGGGKGERCEQSPESCLCSVLFRSACFHDIIISHQSGHYKAFLGTVSKLPVFVSSSHSSENSA